MPTRSVRIALLIMTTIVVALGAVATGIVLENRTARQSTQQAATVTIGGPFRLKTQKGALLSNEDLKGSPFAVFFGFTHCPEICPTTLYEMSEALKQMGPEAEKLRVLFITVDPERDTSEFLATYLQSFDPRIIGLTGSVEDIAKVGKAYRAYWEKVPTGDGDYTMNHTASIFLMDADGKFVGTISYGEAQEPRLAKLRRLVHG